MTTDVPLHCCVRPRATSCWSPDARLLEDLILEIVDDTSTAVIWIHGDVGSGKTTALNYIQQRFAEDSRLVFLDEPSPEEIPRDDATQVVIATALDKRTKTPGAVLLQLQPWRLDDMLEYLLAAHRGVCGSVLERLGHASRQGWSPQIARVVLDQLAADRTLSDPSLAVVNELRQQLPDPARFMAVAELCFAFFTKNPRRVRLARKKSPPRKLPLPVRRLLRHLQVRQPLAIEWVVSQLSDRGASCRDLAYRLPVEMISQIGERCRDCSDAIAQLTDILSRRRSDTLDAMAAGILLRANPDWQPVARWTKVWRFREGSLCRARWNQVDLKGAALTRCDLSGAKLQAAKLSSAEAAGVRFEQAEMQGAVLRGIEAPGGSFFGAVLVGADLSHADLSRVDFSNADLTEAKFVKANLCGANFSAARLHQSNFSESNLVGAKLAGAVITGSEFSLANLSSVDMRDVELDEVNFEAALLRYAQLENVHCPRARFRCARLGWAHLTGSVFPDANFREAKLNGAHLAEINWVKADLRRADLRGASFHLGSSRSGLVDSPIALEGSMTGFYTDDFEELYFKRPEEIRKANLFGADLRGANVENVDFYLVDLREALLDRSQEDQARRSGAILSDS